MAMTQIYRSRFNTDISISDHKEWNACILCENTSFQIPNEFLRHLRLKHCNQEGGSFVCHYGNNNVCASLPLEGVSDKDYEEHVVNHHASTMLARGADMQGSKSKNVVEKWGVYSATQNVTSVVNDPYKGMKRDFFTKTWGETFVEPKEISAHIALPEVNGRHFELYVRRLRKRQRLLNKLSNKAIARDEAAAQSRGTCPASPGQLIANNESIPSMFLSSSFSLEVPSTFYSVFSHITTAGISKRNSKLIQEKLFHILEIVETDMSQQIVKKSSAFFDTMMYLNAQMEQLQLNHRAVSNLRDGISTLKKEVVTEPTRILSLPRKRTNTMNTLLKLEAMSTVKEVQSTIQVMLARQEYSSALDLIATTQDLLHTELAAIKGLRHLSSELSEHEKLIDKMVSVEFIKYVTEDLNRPLFDTIPLLEEDQLIAVVFGVLRLQKLYFIDNLKEEINVAINAAVKQAVAEVVCESETDQNTTSVVDQARSLPIPQWLLLLNAVTDGLKIIMNRVQAIITVISQAVEASSGKSNSSNEGVHAASIVTLDSVGESMLGEAACTKALLSLQQILCGACDFAHDRCAKLLHARSRDQALDKISVGEFLSLSRIIESFVEDTEKICGRKSTAFRMGLQGQASRFVCKFHEERDARLQFNLSTEKWRAVAIPRDLQQLLDHISNSEFLEFPPAIHEGGVKIEENGLRSSSPQMNLTTKKSSPKPIRNDSTSGSTSSGGVAIHGEEYVIVGVCVVVIRLIVEYADCALTLRMASQQLLTKLIDLLRKFNADTCRLLVEAGAVTLGLKTITTRHLALAWRSLQLLLVIIPKLNKHFCALLKHSLVEKHIEQLSREYSEHCSHIEGKIVKVMSDCLSRPLSSWEARSPVPSKSFNDILKSLSKLHETVSGTLTAYQVKIIFEKVTYELKQELRFQMKRLTVSPVGPQSWVVMSELTFYFNHIAHMGITLEETQEDFIRTLWQREL